MAVKTAPPAFSAGRLAPDAGQHATPVLWFAAAAVLVVLPLAVIDMPLLADYPNHVARMHIISNLHEEVFLADRYQIEFDLLPNIAMDLSVPWLARLLPLDVAGRLFLAACLLAGLASVAWLHHTLFGHWSAFPLVAAFFVHHASLLAGLVNFSLGIALVPAALAVWIRLRHASPLRRVLVGGAMAMALYACHLVAVGAYGLLIFGYEWARARDKWSRRDGPRTAAFDMAIAAATGLLPAALFLRLAWRGGDGGVDTDLVFGGVAWKAKALLAPIAGYDLTLDLVTFAVLTGLALVAWRAGWLEIERRMAPGLLLLAAAFVIAPKALWTGGLFDQRFAVLLAPMLIACSRFKSPGGFAGRALPAVLILLFLFRTAVLISTWIEHRGDLAEMRAAIDIVPRGARVLVIRPDKAARSLLPRHRVFHHAGLLASLPTLAVIDKAAFVSTIYAIPGQQQLALRPPFDRLGGWGDRNLPDLADLRHALEKPAEAPSHLRDWPGDFDHVLLLYAYARRPEETLDGLPLTPSFDGEVLELFQIDAN